MEKVSILRDFNKIDIKELINRIRKEGIAFLGAFVLGSDEDDPSDVPFHTEIYKIFPHRCSCRSPNQLLYPAHNLGKCYKEKKDFLNRIFPKLGMTIVSQDCTFNPNQMSIEEVYKSMLA